MLPASPEPKTHLNMGKRCWYGACSSANVKLARKRDDGRRLVWLLFMKGMRSRWCELAMAAAIVAMVVAALIAQRAVSISAERSVHDLAHRLGRNMLVVPAATDLVDFYGHRYGPESLPDGAPASIRSSPISEHVQAIEARLYANAAVAGTPALVVGQELGWPTLSSAEPAVVGAELARKTGLARGASFQLGGVSFQVLNVAATPPDGLDTAVFVPLAAAQRALVRPGQLSALRLGGCWCSIDVATLGREIEKLLPGTRAVTVAGLLQAQQGSIRTMQRYSTVLAIAGFVIIAAVVGILTASRVRRRARELGLLAAIGASPTGLTAFWVVEAAIVGALGAAGGWLVAAPLARQLGARVLGGALDVPADMLLPHLLIAAGVCAGAALVPASWAATRDPTVVLRES
jgi:putative ABC transport system permease protein